MSLAGFGLAGRILLLGVERIVVKRLGQGADAFSAAFLFFWLGGVLLLPLVPWELWGEPLPPGRIVLGALASGAFYSVAFVCYVRSLSEGEASLVSPLYNFNVFFLALIAWAFLGEPLSASKLAGLALLVYGSSWLNRRDSVWRSLAALLTDRACRYMIVASVLIAVGRVIDKSLVAQAPPVTYVCLLYWIISGYILVYALLRRNAGDILHLLRARPGMALAGGAINGYSYLCLLLDRKSTRLNSSHYS